MLWLLPPILWSVAVMTMLVIEWLLPVAVILPAPANLIGIVLLIIGLLVTIGGARQFKVKRTNIKTFDDPDKLVTTGLFCWSRNPMYLGLCVALAGVALWVNHWGAIAVGACFFLACQFWYIPFEEAAASRKFGTEYAEYRQRVRRWL